MIKSTNIRAVFLILFGSLFFTATNAQKTQTKSTDNQLMDWFHEAKFGMFIHFGVQASENYLDTTVNKTKNYEDAVRAFNPVNFDAKEWVRIAKDAGMKYIVFTTKHHDGFCKWDSKLTDWDVIDQTPFKRDIVAELADACKEAGIELGFYYSIADWYHPEYDPSYSNRNGFHFNPNPKADITKYMGFMYGQIKELCENYHPRLFWFDGSAGFRNPNRKRLLGQQEMADLLHSYGAISNSRYGDDDALKFVNYLSTGDNMIPPANIGIDFETAQTMNDSWHFESKDQDWKSPERLLANLINIVGKGGNYLLNVGPNSTGVIPEASVERLKIMGNWLNKNGDAIYGTNANLNLHDLSWGSITQRKVGGNTKIYLNITEWPKNGIFKLYGLNNKVTNASLLANGTKLVTNSAFNAAAGANVITIQIPKIAPDLYVSVIELTVEGDAQLDQSFMQQWDKKLILDTYHATIHDKEIVTNKPLRPIDQRIFTVLEKGTGIMPARGMTVALDQKGQALSWDFRLIEPGTYKVVVLCDIAKDQKWKTDGRMRITVAGQSVENKLEESDRLENPRMSTEVMSSVSILDTVKINTAGMHTLSLELSSDFIDSKPNVRNVQLWPVVSK